MNSNVLIKLIHLVKQRGYKLSDIKQLAKSPLLKTKECSTFENARHVHVLA